MKLSIITAVFNRESSIGQAMRSLQSQTYPHVEHIVVDGESGDDTLSVVKSLADQSTVIISEPDKGIYDALNKGIALATGDAIGILHSDDQFSHSGVLQRVAETFANGDVDIVYGDLDYVDRRSGTQVIRRWKAGKFWPGRLKRGWMPPHPSVFLARSVIEKHGVYDTDYAIAADYDALIRYFRDPDLRTAYLPETLVNMRVGGASNASLRAIIRKSSEDYRTLRRHGIGGWTTLLAKNLTKVGQFF